VIVLTSTTPTPHHKIEAPFKVLGTIISSPPSEAFPSFWNYQITSFPLLEVCPNTQKYSKKSYKPISPSSLSKNSKNLSSPSLPEAFPSVQKLLRGLVSLRLLMFLDTSPALLPEAFLSFWSFIMNSFSPLHISKNF